MNVTIFGVCGDAVTFLEERVTSHNLGKQKRP